MGFSNFCAARAAAQARRRGRPIAAEARVYSPFLGRFLQTDPIGYSGGINLYAYVENDPINMRDPSGWSGDTLQFGNCADINMLGCDLYGNVPFGGNHPPAYGDGGNHWSQVVNIGGWSQSQGWGALADSIPRRTYGQLAYSETISLPQSNQKKVDCNSSARQLAKFANDVSVAAGGSGLVFAGLGAEPVAAGLELTAGIAEVVAAGAGAYVAYSEGDWGPLKSTLVGKVAGSIGGFGAGVLGTRSVSKFGLTVTKAPSATQTKAAGYVSGFAGDLLNQVCP